MNIKIFVRRAFLPFLVVAAYGAGRLTPASTPAQAAITRISTTIAKAPSVQRRAFRMRIHPEKAGGYKAWHKRVTPALLSELRAAGIRNYSLYLDKDGSVFGYMESANWKRADAAMSKSRASAPWQKIMKPYIVQTKSGENSISLLEEVFHLQ